MSYDAPPPPPPSQGGYGQSPYGGAPQANNTKAIWSLVTGILGIFCYGIVLGPVAFFLGRSAKADAARAGMPASGLATAGVVLGIIAFVLGVVQIILAVAQVGPYEDLFNMNNGT